MNSNCTLVQDVNGLDVLEQFLKSKDIFACDLESSGLDTRTAKIEGIGLGISDKQYFISFPNNLPVKEYLERVFKNKEVIFHNAKYDLKLLLENKLPIPAKIHDTMIMSWLIDENRQHGLKPLTKLLLGREAKKWNDLDRTQTLFRDEKDILKELSDYCGDDVKNTFDLYTVFKPLIEKEGLLVDYEKIELKLIRVITDMEMRGIRLNIKWIEDRTIKIKNILDELEDKIQILIGDHKINILSPLQLETYLFDILGYSPSIITNKGKRSTDNNVLKKIVKEMGLTDMDFVPLLLKFRELDKIYRTYLIGLKEQVDENNIIHASFLQHGTRTGRLSSNNPNLQNIPARNDKWNIRKAFIPRDGYKFLIADYSQIELRLLAHFSKDKHMIETFLNDGDIHSKTMKLTGTKRKVAKGINFGLVYGMGPRTLAQTLKIKEEDAKKYINRFFNGYKQVLPFIRKIQQKAMGVGYVNMITGRKRRFHEFKDRRWFNLIKRQAINTKIQGSSADLIKIAMIKLDNNLKGLDTHQLIQIHDEILIEVPISKVEEVKKIIIDTMENAIKISVPLKVNIVEGDYWVKS